MEGRKPYRNLTRIEIYRRKQNVCVNCEYFSREGVGNSGKNVSNKTCDYLLITVHSRGCDPRDCIKKGVFKKASGKSKRRAILY